MSDETPTSERRKFKNQAMADVITAAYSEERLTQKMLAERTGITAVTLQRILAGKRDINIDQLFALAEALRLSPTELVERALRRAAKLEKEADEAAAAGGDNVTPIR